MKWSSKKDNAIQILARRAEMLSKGRNMKWQQAIADMPQVFEALNMTPEQIRKAWSFRRWKYKYKCCAPGCHKPAQGATYCKTHAAENTRKAVRFKQIKRGTAQ